VLWDVTELCLGCRREVSCADLFGGMSATSDTTTLSAIARFSGRSAPTRSTDDQSLPTV